MSRIIAWRAPAPTPDQIARQERHLRFRELSNELKAHPGEWALIFERFEATPENLREHLEGVALYGVRWTFDGRPYGSANYSRTEDSGPYDVYARYDSRFDRSRQEAE